MIATECAGCIPEPLPPAVTDPFGEIPDFLNRALHPEYADAWKDLPLTDISRVEITDTGINRARVYETDEDRRLRAHYQQLELHSAKAVTAEQKEARAEKREEKKAEKAAHHERKMQQRKHFVKDFKWGVDGL